MEEKDEKKAMNSPEGALEKTETDSVEQVIHALLSTKLRDLMEENRKLKVQIQTLTNEKQVLQDKNDSLTTSLQESLKIQQSLQEQVVSLQSENKLLREKVTHLEEQVKNLTDQAKLAAQELETLKTEVKTLTDQAKLAAQEHETLKTEVKTLTDQAKRDAQEQRAYGILADLISGLQYNLVELVQPVDANGERNEEIRTLTKLMKKDRYYAPLAFLGSRSQVWKVAHTMTDVMAERGKSAHAPPGYFVNKTEADILNDCAPVFEWLPRAADLIPVAFRVVQEHQTRLQQAMPLSLVELPHR